MKSKAVALGHPIHPMLIPFPFAFLTGAVLFDAAGWFRDLPSWWTTGGHLSLAGIATALLAAIPGVIDYLYRRKEVVQLNGESSGTSEVAGR